MPALLLLLLSAVSALSACGQSFVYPLPSGDPTYDGFAVRVDGVDAPVSAARCSAIPFNRRWPGHQRDISQSELCGFVRFSFEGRAQVEVTANREFRDFVIRPLSRGVKAVRDGRKLTFEISEAGSYSVELDGHHHNLTVFADEPEKRTVREGQKGVRYFGPGSHDIGLVELKGGETVYVDAGAVVYGAFIASNATDIAILGRGIIDMSRIKERILFDVKTGDGGMAVLNATREFLVRMTCCSRIRIEDVTLRDSLCYNIGLFGCEDVDIRNVKVIGQWRYNTDGIDLHNCRRARVVGCYVRSFDDSLCFKAHEGWGNCEDCVFEKCVVWNDWGKPLEVGVECRAPYLRRLTFRDIDVIHMIGQPMDVVNVDYGTVRDILFEDIRVEQDDLIPLSQIQKSDEASFDFGKGVSRLPLLYASSIVRHPEYSSENGGKWSGGGHIDGVTIRNVSVTNNAGRLEVVLRGLDGDHRNVGHVFENVTLNGKPATPANGNVVVNDKGFAEYGFVEPADDAARNHSTEMNRGEPASNEEGDVGGTRVLVIGNSIALHQPLPEIGWTNCWGMAASACEKDFAHLVAAEVTRRTGRRANLRVKSGYYLEKDFRGTDISREFAREIAFRPEILVVALGENARIREGTDDEMAWQAALVSLVKAIRAGGCDPVVVMRAPFWPNLVKRRVTESAAKESGARFVDAGLLGADPANKALGLFEHKGVAGHPGDLGMRRIADLVLDAIYPDRK